jgi:ribA/ribD-fused uncharacterized protein
LTSSKDQTKEDQMATAAQETQVKIPSKHYSTDPDEALFFYGGPFSNFITEMGGNWGDKRLFIIAYHLWSEGPTGNFGMRGVAEKIAYGAEYRSVEHFFQASKAQDYDDHEWVRHGWRPQEAKQRGRQIDMRPDWDDVKYGYMLVGLRKKFEPGSLTANLLLGTGERFIAEDSPTDDVWGIRDRDGGFTGQNLLGKALMEVRKELRERQQADAERERVIAEGMDALDDLRSVTDDAAAD